MNIRTFILAAAFMASVSCLKETPAEQQYSGTLVEKEFTTSCDTKVHLQENGTSLTWSADDCVSVWDGVANRKFTVKEFDGASATLVGYVDENATEFFAVYPYSEDLAISAPEKEDREIRMNFPFVSDQKAVPGNVDDGLCVALARTSDGTLDFINKTAMLKFSFAEDLADVKIVTVQSHSNYISGTYNVEWAGNLVHQGITANRGQTITLSNADGTCLRTGTNYYVVLPPNNNDGGFSVSVTLSDGSVYTKSSDKVMKMESGSIIPLAKVPLTKSMFITAEAYGRYEMWKNGIDIEICGNSYNKSALGDGTFIAKGQTYEISEGGVYFIDPYATVTLSTTKMDDIVIIGNDPAMKSKVTNSGFYLNPSADVACLGVDFRPVETWPDGKDIINETTAAGDIRFEDCRLYHPSNGRYVVYAGTSGEGLTSPFASFHMKDCIYTIENPDMRAYMMNCPLAGASLTFEGSIFHCCSYDYLSTQFKLIGLSNKSQTIASVKINGNIFANLSSSSSGMPSYISSGPTYEYMELTDNIFYLPKLTKSDVSEEDIATEDIIHVVPADGKAYGNWYFTGVAATSAVVNAFYTTPSWTTSEEAMTKAMEIPFVQPMVFDTGEFIRLESYTPAESGYDIYLLIGQSNAAGRGALTADDKTTYLKGVMQWNPATESMQPAIQPLNLLSTVRKKAAVQGFNLAGPFATKVHKETGRPILLVVNARGETLISAWMKEGNGGKITTYDKDRDDPEKVGQSVWLYAEAVRVTKQAMKYGTLKGILWHQGCGNASESTYLTNLKKVVTDLRNDLGCSDVPFVAGQLLPEFKNAQYFNPMILTIGGTIANAYCATSEGCVSIGDGTHFDRDSHVKMGERYADIILKQVYGK